MPTVNVTLTPEGLRRAFPWAARATAAHESGDISLLQAELVAIAPELLDGIELSRCDPAVLEEVLGRAFALVVDLLHVIGALEAVARKQDWLIDRQALVRETEIAVEDFVAALEEWQNQRSGPEGG
jgi:hypothetical protein